MVPNIIHIFDISHILKLLRNNLLSRMIGDETNIHHFNLNNLIELNYEFNLKLNSNIIFPTDKQELAPVLKILSEEILNSTKNSKYPEIKFGLHIFLEMMLIFKSIFEFENNPNNLNEYEKNIKNVEKLINYYKKIIGLTEETSEYCITTLESIKIFLINNKSNPFKMNSLTSNDVEIFFSIMRGKVPYFDCSTYFHFFQL
jgi:hypothetical protein